MELFRFKKGIQMYQRKTAAAIILFMLLAHTLFAAAPGVAHEGHAPSAEEVEQMKQQIEKLKRQIDEMNRHIIHRPETKARTKMIDGLEFAVGVTGIVQGSSGADDLAGDDRTDANGSLDLEMQAGVGNQGTAFLLVEAREGAGLTDEIETLHGINADALDDDFSFKLTEAWYEHAFMNERLLFTLGKVDLTNYFDGNAVANDETLQFLTDGFVNNIVIEFPEDNGPGLRLAYLFSDAFDIGFAWADSDGDFEDLGNDPFGILELKYKTTINELEGHYRLSLWANLSDHEEWDDPMNNDEKNWGASLSFDQALSERFTGFLRAGFQDESVSQVDWALSLGGDWRGPIPSRTKDIFGFALGYGHLSDDYRDAVTALDTDHEQKLELYYAIHVNEHLLISPDLQIIRNPAGLENADTITLLGVRSQILF
jgi:carbohydrate-selective porin OprB